MLEDDSINSMSTHELGLSRGPKENPSPGSSIFAPYVSDTRDLRQVLSPLCPAVDSERCPRLGRRGAGVVSEVSRSQRNLYHRRDRRHCAADQDVPPSLSTTNANVTDCLAATPLSKVRHRPPQGPVVPIQQLPTHHCVHLDTATVVRSPQRRHLHLKNCCHKVLPRDDSHSHCVSGRIIVGMIGVVLAPVSLSAAIRGHAE